MKTRTLWQASAICFALSALLWIIAAVLFLLPSSAKAEPSWHIQLHGLSHHMEKKITGKWNENNAGFGVRYQHDTTWGVQAGAYRNSYNRNTTYAVVDFTPLFGGAVGVFGGYASGYRHELPLVAGLMVRGQWEQFSLTARLVPKTVKNQTAVIAFEAGWRFR